MRALAAVLLTLTLPACSGTEPATPEPAPAPAPAPAPVKPAPPPAAEVWELPEGHNPALLDPTKATEKAPATFDAVFETGKGNFTVRVHRDWSPNGADRFYNLVKIGFYDGGGFFRTVPGFVAQFGLSPYPAVSEVWKDAKIEDDPVKEGNKRGRIVFATSGPNTRTTQLFINYGDNARLDQMGFSSFGEVVDGMDVVDELHKTGDGGPRAGAPDQGKIQNRGNAYLEAKFPELDFVKKVTIK